jgi:hypothetical protein
MRYLLHRSRLHRSGMPFQHQKRQTPPLNECNQFHPFELSNYRHSPTELMMTKLALVTALTSLIAVSAQAQTTSPAQPVPAPGTTSPPAATTPDAGAPLPGANSFTESQAKSRIEQLGYTNVTGLAKDSDGVWRGTAMKDGKSQRVAIDFRGNIVVGQQ